VSVVVERAQARPGMSLRDVARHWLVYGVGSVANRLVGFLLLPLYTRFLTPEDYGIKAMVVAGVDVVGIFLGLGLRAAMIRFASDTGAAGAPRREAVSTAITLVAGVLGTGIAVALWQADALAAFVFGNAVYAPYLRLGLMTLFFTNVFEACMAHLQLRQRSGAFSAISLGAVASGVSLNMVFVVILGLGVRGLLYSELITYAAFCAGLLLFTLREVGTAFSPALARQMLRYGTPLLFTPLVWTVINQADRLFLTRYASLAEVGIYSMAIQFAQVLFIAVIQPFANFWEPAQFQVMRHPDGAALFGRTFHLVMSVLLLAAFAAALFVDDVIRVMTAPAFWSAATLVPLFLLAHVTLALCLFLDSGLFLRGWTGSVAAIALVSAVINVACNAVLVPLAGTTGAAAARLATAAGMAALTWLAAQRAWRIPIDARPFGKAAAAAVLLFWLSTWLPREPLALSLLLKAALVVGLLAVIVRRSDWNRALALRRELQLRFLPKSMDAA
jgi:O-antigen/teichoic acid export membrane protein